MIVRYPEWPLNQYVNQIWLTPVPDEDACAELALPTGTIELVIELGTSMTPVICGVHNRSFVIGASTGRSLGVHFLPGGASAILPVVTRETRNLRIDLDLVSREYAGALVDVLDPSCASTDDALLEALEVFLTARIESSRHPSVISAIARLNRSDRPDIRTLVDESGFSHRRFNELFRSEVGLSTKTFSRVARFQQAISRIEMMGHSLDECGLDWADLAVECEFYDQSHLIHEFRRHSQMTPAEYLARRTDRLNHPALVVEGS